MKKIKGDMQKRCHTGQYTGEIIRGKEGREGNGHIYYIIYTHGRRRERERKGTDTGTEGRNRHRQIKETNALLLLFPTEKRNFAY